MKNNMMIKIATLILVMVASRLIPHLPNMTAIGAVALTSGFLFSSWRQSVLVTLAAMLIADSLIGFHSTMFFVYLPLMLVAVGSHLWMKQLNLRSLALGSLSSSALFFAISNLGVFLVDGFYPKTLSGFVSCYVAAIPFWGYDLAGTLLYSTAITAVLAYAKLQMKWA